ncbi:hypothetical protein GGR54DRAFT_582639 [Hypoxylon sp. NC1633]|nr:hypothetical protein GGR54DRAFT_582639 [Hypoxylon sp. NC1633]
MVWSTVLAFLTRLLLLVNPIYNAIAFVQCRRAWAPYMIGSAPECWNGDLMESLDYIQQCFNIFAHKRKVVMKRGTRIGTSDKRMDKCSPPGNREVTGSMDGCSESTLRSEHGIGHAIPCLYNSSHR